MIGPRTIAQMVEATRLDTVKAAIVAEMKRLLVGVTVVNHPGKLDINDVVAKAVVSAPGVAIGWARVRSDRLVDGAFDLPVEWAAYIVVEDYALRSENRAVGREVLAHAIGGAILDILGDPDVSTWGVPGLDHPAPDPAPALVPMFTSKAFEAGTAYYAVTWTQVLRREGASLFGGATPAFTASAEGVEIVSADDPLPPEVRAWMKEF